MIKKFIGLAGVLFVAIILFVLLLVKKEGASSEKNFVEETFPQRTFIIDRKKMESKIEKAINFLKSRIDKTYLFRDPYLMCLEANEECNSHMNVLKLALYLLSERFENELITRLSDLFVNAKFIEESEYKKVKRKKFRDYRIDVYCNFVWRYSNNPHLVKELINNYKEEYKGWEDVKKYSKKGLQWKKIRNEGYCTRALARVGNYSWLIEKIVEEHYKIYKDAVDRNFPNVRAFTGWLVFEIVYLYKNGVELDEKYVEVVRGFFNYLKDRVIKREGKYPYSAVYLLFLIKECPYINAENKEELIRICLSVLIDAIDEEGRLFPVIIKGKPVNPQNLSYSTIDTLDALNLILFFQKLVE